MIVPFFFFLFQFWCSFFCVLLFSFCLSFVLFSFAFSLFCFVFVCLLVGRGGDSSCRQGNGSCLSNPNYPFYVDGDAVKIKRQRVVKRVIIP